MFKSDFDMQQRVIEYNIIEYKLYLNVKLKFIER